MDGGGGFWDWGEELKVLQQAQAATQASDESSESAQNAASVGVQIDQSEGNGPLLLDLIVDPSCWRADDSHQAVEHLGTPAPVLSGQSEAFDLDSGSSVDEACGLGSDTISIGVPNEPDSDSAPEWHLELAHAGATFRGACQGTAHGGVGHGEDPFCPIELSSTDCSEPHKKVDNQPQDVAACQHQEDGVCGNDSEHEVDRVCADGRASGGITDEESEAQSLDLSAMDGVRVRLDFGCLAADGGKLDASEDDARPSGLVADCVGSVDATRGRIFALPFPLSLPLTIPFLPLRALGLLAQPLRHAPKVALILLSMPAPRPQQVEPREDPGVLPKMYRRRRRSRRVTGRGHFTRKHPLLDLSAADWLHNDWAPNQSRYPSPRSSMAECAEQMSPESSLSSNTAQEHSEQSDEVIGPGEPRADGADGGDPVTSARGLLVSADTSADSGFSPQQKKERSRPSQLEISEATPLVHSQRWESDSFSLAYSPSSLSLDGGFGYRGGDGGAEVSPMSSRSSSSSDLGERETHSDTGSSTDESDSHLYLPTDHLLLTPPPNLAVAEPPVKPLSEESRRFVLPPGVTDPAEKEDLEQQWANRLRMRRAEHADQHYMSAAELMSPPWSNLVFWHGSDKKGQPVLYCKLGLAVRTLPRHMQDRMGCALYSMVELAENSLWRPECGWGFQRMTTVVDAEGLGITRMAPVEALKHGFRLIHRDYPARQGYTYIINVPPLLSMMIGVFKRVIGYDEKEANERLGVYGRNYRSHLQKDFEPDMLHVDYGGSCPCCSVGEDREPVTNAGSSPMDARSALKRRGRPEDWVLDFVPSYQR